jgi:hypothetical protein
VNKKLLIAIGILLLIVGVGAYFFMSSRLGSTTPTTQQTATSGESSAQKSLRDLIALGESQECLFSTSEESSGTIYITSGKMRGDFSSTVEGETTISHMLVEDKTSYVWIEGQDMGYKFTHDESADTQNGTATQQNVDLDQKADYTCKPWVVDSSMFTLPQNIEFKDMSELTGPSGTQDTKAAQCAACDSAPEDAQAQCRAALGCD